MVRYFMHLFLKAFLVGTLKASFDGCLKVLAEK